MIGTGSRPALDPRIAALIAGPLSTNGAAVAAAPRAAPATAPSLAPPTVNPDAPPPMASAPAPEPVHPAPVADAIAAAPSLTPTIKRPGFFDNIRDFVNSPEGRAALMRSAGATLQGGLGAGIQAGTEYFDKQHALKTAQQQWAAENALHVAAARTQQQQADQTGQHYQNQDEQGYMGVAQHDTQLAIENYRAKMDAMLKRAGIDVDLRRIEQEDTNNRRTTGASVYATDAGTNNNIRSTNASIYGSNQSLAGTKYSTDGRSYDAGRAAAGIGSKSHPTKATLAIQPMPASAGDAVVGNTYRLNDGSLGQWNGSGFVPVR